VAAGQSRATGSSGSRSAERAVQDPSLGGRAGRRPGGEVGGTRKTGGVGEVTENPPQRRGAALLASGERRLGSGGVPDAGMWRATSLSAKLQKIAWTRKAEPLARLKPLQSRQRP
jgi:hypothetical protein